MIFTIFTFVYFFICVLFSGALMLVLECLYKKEPLRESLPGSVILSFSLWCCFTPLYIISAIRIME